MDERRRAYFDSLHDVPGEPDWIGRISAAEKLAEACEADLDDVTAELRSMIGEVAPHLTGRSDVPDGHGRARTLDSAARDAMEFANSRSLRPADRARYVEMMRLQAAWEKAVAAHERAQANLSRVLAGFEDAQRDPGPYARDDDEPVIRGSRSRF